MFGNGYQNNQQMGYNTNMMPHQMGNMIPTGGFVAKKMKPHPYINMRGTFRKPNQNEIITEIKLATGIGQHAKVVKATEFQDVQRHCCTVEPYFHILQKGVYEVTMPDGDIQVEFFAHPQCATIIVNSDSFV